MSTPEELEARVRRIDLEVAQVSPPDSPMNSPLESLQAYHCDPSYDLWTSARSKIHNILRRFPNQPSEEIEFDLHDLWDTIIRTAIITHADHPAQDRLVAEVVLARELGSLGPHATTADGEVLSGLPFLVGYITAACSGKLMPLRREERLNLAAFTARLVAAGVRAPELGSCALFVLRETLETDLPATDDEDRKSIERLLPAAVAWFNFAGHRLAVFSGGNGHEPLSGEEGTLTTVGQLAREAGILEPGFSTKRWHFWRQRLEALSSYAYVSMIRRPALQGKKSMDMWSEYVGDSDINMKTGMTNSDLLYISVPVKTPEFLAVVATIHRLKENSILVPAWHDGHSGCARAGADAKGGDQGWLHHTALVSSIPTIYGASGADAVENMPGSPAGGPTWLSLFEKLAG